jgi:hypothetical protein
MRAHDVHFCVCLTVSVFAVIGRNSKTRVYCKLRVIRTTLVSAWPYLHSLCTLIPVLWVLCSALKGLNHYLLKLWFSCLHAQQTAWRLSKNIIFWCSIIYYCGLSEVSSKMTKNSLEWKLADLFLNLPNRLLKATRKHPATGIPKTQKLV